MIDQIFRNKLLYIGIHFFLGFIVTFLPISKIYPLLIIIVGLFIIYKSKNINEEALYFSAYLVGAEVFIRMSGGTLLYELGKYGIMLFVLLGLFIGPIKQKNSISILFYILLILVGILFTEVPPGESIRKAIIFNLSGPISLGVFAIYCYKRIITIPQLNELLFMSLLPIFSIVSYVYFRTPSLEELVFSTGSNFATSGGFGPNQVSTIIAFGAFILAVFLFIRVNLSFYIFLDAFFLAYFTYRVLLTFSRGGLITGSVAFILFTFFMFLNNKVTLTKITKYIFISIFLFLGIWLYTSNITGGMIDNRYAGKNSIGKKKEDVSSGRLDIINMQLESFLESPFFGIGVGNGKYKRLESGEHVTAASHNEVGRLIEEHGIMGIFALIILLTLPLENIYFSNNYQRAFLVAFFVFWFLTINHTAMRIAFPAFAYGLSLIRITKDDE
ncbi:O-antigen ligase family protein [Polaribacter sargassicola]|uniref:O-antigen ligase family protein n=1 Tax=Polaribacter sargassicola TaxID=2836891 RepID=UPI001F3C1589|nr:O-antigen ligase family protein [Polaribacter sp. DS7-9]MCG1036615.1 O-antigen ligase family protein [Polaribacter sp. DS7-9]